VRELQTTVSIAGRMARRVRPAGSRPHAHGPGGSAGGRRRSSVPDPLHWLWDPRAAVGTGAVRARNPAVVVRRLPGQRNRGFLGCSSNRAGSAVKSRWRVHRPRDRATPPGLIPVRSVAGACAASRL